MSENILSVQNLHTSFHTDKGEVKAVNGVTFNLEKGKILGIVGESGSGKSVTAYSIMRILEKNGRITEGKILYKGQDIAEFSEKQMRGVPWKMLFYYFPGSHDELKSGIYGGQPVKGSH